MIVKVAVPVSKPKQQPEKKKKKKACYTTNS
jgi:hypothetical protein